MSHFFTLLLLGNFFDQYRDCIAYIKKYLKKLTSPWNFVHKFGASLSLILSKLQQFSVVFLDKNSFIFVVSVFILFVCVTGKSIESCPEVEPTLQNIVITQGNPGLPWVIFHVESTIDYFVCFSLIIWEFKT